jgi:hypothetical protein
MRLAPVAVKRRAVEPDNRIENFPVHIIQIMSLQENTTHSEQNDVILN